MRSFLAGLLLFAVACCTSPEYAEKAKVDRILRSSVCVRVAQESAHGRGIGIGSGFVAAHTNGVTLVVTAGHVCDGKVFAVQIADVNENHHSGSVVYLDPRDVCILASPGTWGQVAPLAKSHPYLGAPVIFAGATKGLWGKGQAVVTDARYSGPTEHEGVKMSVLSGVTTNGASGAAVFYRGEVTGIVVGVLAPAMTPILVVPFDVLTVDLRTVLSAIRKQ